MQTLKEGGTRNKLVGKHNKKKGSTSTENKADIKQKAQTLHGCASSNCKKAHLITKQVPVANKRHQDWFTAKGKAWIW